MKFSEISEEDKALLLMDKPLRECRYLRPYCCICNILVQPSQYYYDGGYGKRAHEMCVKGNLPVPESLSA